MMACVPAAHNFHQGPTQHQTAFVISRTSHQANVTPDYAEATVKRLLATHDYAAPTAAHHAAVWRYLSTVVSDASSPQHTSPRFVLAQFMASDVVMSVELVAFLWAPPAPTRSIKSNRCIYPLFVLQHPTHTLPELLTSTIRPTAAPITTSTFSNSDVSATYLDEDVFLCVLGKLQDVPSPVEGSTPSSRVPPYHAWCRTPSRNAKNATPSTQARAGKDKLLSPKPHTEDSATTTYEKPSSVSTPEGSVTTTAPTPISEVEDPPAPATAALSDWIYKTPVDALVSAIVDTHAELSACQHARIDLLSRVSDNQLISTEFANFSLLECQPNFFTNQPEVPATVLQCRGKPLTGAILKDTFPRTISLSGVVPWADCEDDIVHRDMAEVYCETLESIGTIEADVQVRLTQPGFILSKSLPADQVQPSGVLLQTGLLGSMLKESLNHLATTTTTTPQKLELYKELVNKLLSLPRSIIRTSIRKQIKSNNLSSLRSCVSVLEFNNNEAAVLGALSVTVLNTVALREFDTAGTTNVYRNQGTILLAATFANSIILTQSNHGNASAALDDSGDAVSVASKALRKGISKAFHNVTAIWAPELGADAFTSTSPDFKEINDCLNTILTACNAPLSPSAISIKVTTPAQRCNDLGVAVVVAAACLLWRVAEPMPNLDKMPTTTPEFAEAKNKINDSAKMFNDICECALAAILVDINEGGLLPSTLVACQVSVIGNLQRTISTGPDTMRGKKVKLSLLFYTRNLETIQGGTDLLQTSLPTTTVMGRLLATRSALLYAKKKSGMNFKRQGINSDLLDGILRTLPYPTVVNPTLSVMKVVEACGWDSHQGIAN